MAAFYGYGRVLEQGFIGFEKELSQSAWGKIVISSKLYKNGRLLASPKDLPVEQYWKIRAMWTLTELALVAHQEDAATVADRGWDGTQRRFRNQNAVHLDDPDPAKRAAAERIREHMMMGGGTEQTKLSHEKEIDFGRSQVFKATQEPLRSDIELLGMQPLIDEIAMRSEALAQARGRGADGETPLSHSHRVRLAKSACVAAFNSIHGDLDWLIQQTDSKTERNRLIELRAPFLKLLERYSTSAGEPDSEPDSEPDGQPDSAATPLQVEP